MAATKSKATTKAAKAAPKKQSKKAAVQPPSFFTFKFTYQTVYWLILCTLVLALGIWVIDLNVKVQKIYDQIDMNNTIQYMQSDKK
jgi:hypothetical protein